MLDGARPHRDYRRHLDAHLGAHLSGIHRPPDLECVARYGERDDVGGVRTAQACRETSAQIAAVEGRAKHHEIGLLRLDLLRKSTHERKRGISVARDLEDRRLAELLRLRGELEAHAPQTAIPTLRDDEDLHRTFASSRSKVASCCAVCLASPSLRILPAPRAGGGSIATISRAGADESTFSDAKARSGISFFFAFMIPGRLG